MTARRLLGWFLIAAGTVAAVPAFMVTRDFVTIDYAGYEVGLMRGFAIFFITLAVTGWTVGLILLLRNRSG